MSLVGGFPGLSDARRRVTRAPINPMDKCTVISIYPKEINETKPTIEPGYFHIDAGSRESPALLVVGPSSWWREIDPEQPLLELPVWSVQVADSIVRDFCNGLVCYIPDESSPGIAWIEGAHNIKAIREKFPHVLEKLNKLQMRWYKELVTLTNTLWAQSNGNPRTVSDDARHAARELSMEGLDWMHNFTAMDMVRCIACGQLRNPAFPVCTHCHHVDMTHPRAKELSFIPQGGGQPVSSVIGKINQVNTKA